MIHHSDVAASPPTNTSLRRPAAVVTLLAMVLALLGLSAPAQAQPLYHEDGTASISGSITTESGDPASTASVWLYSSDWHYFTRRAEVQPDGSYEFTELPAGDYVVTASLGSVNTCDNAGTTVEQDSNLREEVSLTEGQNLSGVDFIGPSFPYPLTGEVIDQDGNPVSDRSIWVTQPDSGTFADLVTDANGEFSLCVSAGTVTIDDGEYEANAYFPTETLTIEGADQHVQLVLQNNGTIEGTVTAGGQPVADAEVNAWSESDSGGTYGYTDSNGNYSLSIRPGDDYIVEVYADSYLTQIYDGHSRGSDEPFDLVTVESGTATTGINFDLLGSASYGGPLTYDGESPTPSIVQECHEGWNGEEECYDVSVWSSVPVSWVSAYTWDGSEWTLWERITGQASYNFWNVPTDTPHVVGAEAVGYCPTFWDGAPSLAAADSFTLETGSHSNAYGLNLSTDCDEGDLITEDDLPAPGVAVSVNPNRVSPGDTTTLTASGLLAGEDADIFFGDSDGELLTTAEANSDGELELTITMPDDATLGDHLITVVGQESEREGFDVIELVDADAAEELTVTANPAEVEAGGQTLVTTEGLDAGENAHVSLQEGSSPIATSPADEDGKAEALVTIPEALEPGPTELFVRGEESERQGSVEITILPVSDSGGGTGHNGDSSAGNGSDSDGTDGTDTDSDTSAESSTGGADPSESDSDASATEEAGSEEGTGTSSGDSDEAGTSGAAASGASSSQQGLAATGADVAGYALAAFLILLAGLGAVRFAGRTDESKV